MEQKVKPKKVVTIKILGISAAKEAMGGSTVKLEVAGDTYGDLLDEIESRYGSEIRKALSVQVMRNGKVIDKEDLSQPLEDEDTYSFISMIAGG